ncbi:MAG TPA: transglycosylase domain-containing protein [Solirubrobacteraceae bacterium]|nr:transglycosylase domain-containing protein [Solirubrobacteraceae bacterium]
MRRRRHNQAGAARILLIGGGTLACALIIGGFAAVGYVLSVAHSAAPLSARHPILGGGSSQVFAANGQALGFIQADELRTPVGWSEIPKNVKDATVAIEDQRFYKHDGVDFEAIIRAAVKDVTHGKALQGGSTITMQLMRNLYLGQDARSFRDKVIEAKLALEYEEHHTKPEVLTSYLNSVPYGTVGGQTALGVQAASRIFFDKPVSQLNLQQAALLAGLPQAPSQYNPFRDARAARQRRNEVLLKMAQLHYVSAQAAASAEAAPLEVKRGYFYSERKENFFFEYVHQQLVERYGARTVALGGLRVYTTIDLRLQRLARKAIKEVLSQREDPSAAIVTLNPSNGYIEAMAESASYGSSQYNLAADGHRQPGSTWKAIDLADALSRGVDPNTTYYDSHFLQPGWLPGYPEYSVKTFGGEQSGVVDLVQATLKSDNTVYAQLAADLGEETITQMAYKMGVQTHLSSYAAEAIGGLTLGVTPLEMSVVYATLADGGWRNTPIAITKVVFPDGRVDSSWGRPHRKKVLSEAITGEETNILHENSLGGTAVRSAINCPTAAKTGTTSEFIDAWLDGYNSEYATVVWMGYPNRRVSMTDVHGELQQGGALPAVIWHDYMAGVTEGHPCAALHTSSAGIAFQPFYGKYATTGRYEAEAEAAPRKRGGGHHAGHSRGGASAPKRDVPRVTSGEPPPQEAPESAPEAHGGNAQVQPSGGAGPGK